MAQSPFHSPFLGPDPIAAHTDPRKVAARAALAKGILKSPDGKVFKSPAALTQYMRDHPDWVSRQQGWLRATMGNDVLRNFLKDANSIPSTKDRNTGKRSTPPFSQKDITTIAPTRTNDAGFTGKPSAAAAAVAPPTPAAGHDPTSRGGGQVTATSKQRNAAPMPKGAARTAGGGNPTGRTYRAPVPSVFDQAIKGLLGLDPSVGRIDAQQIMDLFDQGNQAQVGSIQRAIDNIPGQKAQDLAMLDSWYNQVGGQVEKARQRGIDMTAALTAANQSNAQGLMASLGGSANPANESVGAMAQNDVGTLNALGAADAQFLSDMGPLLKGEAASMKANEVQRLDQMMQGYQDQLAQVQGSNSAAKAQLALQLAQMNQQAGQTEFQNKSGLLNTIAGLGLSGMQMDADTQKLLAGIQQNIYNQSQMNARTAASQQGQNARAAASNQVSQSNAIMDFITSLMGNQQDAQQAATKRTDQKIADANAAIGKYIDPQQFQGHYGGLAPPELVKSVLDFYRQAGNDLTDPAVQRAASGAIRSFGFKVDPKWIGGWH